MSAALSGVARRLSILAGSGSSARVNQSAVLGPCVACSERSSVATPGRRLGVRDLTTHVLCASEPAHVAVATTPLRRAWWPVAPAASADAVPGARGRRHFGSGKGSADKPDHPYTTGNARYLPGFSVPAPRPLDQIIKLPLLEREQPHHIRDIWMDYHEDREDCVADVLTPSEHAGIMERARRYPMFVFPVRKGQGKFYMLVSQWQENSCMFTYLEDYQKNPFAAEPYCAVTLYDDFAKRKQMVLVRADKSAYLTKLETQRLVNLIKHYYLTDPAWIEKFNDRPDEFDFTAYIADCP